MHAPFKKSRLQDIDLKIVTSLINRLNGLFLFFSSEGHRRILAIGIENLILILARKPRRVVNIQFFKRKITTNSV